MTADTITAIKKALMELPLMKVEFSESSSEGNSIISPTDDFEDAYFTVIGCGDKQDDLGRLIALAVNSMPIILSTLESLQRENEELEARRKEEQERADRMAIDWIGFCTDMGLDLDTQEAVAEELQAIIGNAKAREAELMDALKPFADLALAYDPPEGDDDRKCWHAESTPTLGDLRRAKSALSTGDTHGN